MKSSKNFLPVEQRITDNQPDQSTAPQSNIFHLKLVGGRSSDSDRLHHMRDGCVVLYKRTQSTVWQVRFKLFDQKWHHYTTKHKELEYARRVASTRYDRARFAEEMGLPLRSATPTHSQAASIRAVLNYFELTLEGGFGTVSTECAAPFCTQFAGAINAEVLAPGGLFQSAALPTELPGRADKNYTRDREGRAAKSMT